MTYIEIVITFTAIASVGNFMVQSYWLNETVLKPKKGEIMAKKKCKSKKPPKK